MPVEANLQIVWPCQGPGEQSVNWVHKLDIVFVHGLNPKGNVLHSNQTWTARDGTMWPKDLLPLRIPHARVMLFEYNSSVVLGASATDLRGHAHSLLDTLQSTREDSDTLSHPIILVGHSLGGLLIKQALVLAKQDGRVFGGLLRCVQSIAFFATPHRGGNGATIGDIAAKTASFVMGSGRNDMVKNLKKQSKALAQLSADFSHQYEEFQFLSVIESMDLMHAPLNPIATVVVERSSATLGLPGHRERVVELQRDHSQICKFEGGEDPGFVRVIRHLKRMADDACRADPVISPPVTFNTIDVALWYLTHNLRRQASLQPKFLYSTLYQKSDWPLIGRNDLVQWINLFLKSDETCLILHGPAGAGKSKVVSHVSYSWSSKVSVFWFDAESRRSIERSFETVADSIKMRQPSQAPRAKPSFKDWLSEGSAGPWLAIFDDAYPGLDLRGLLPRTGGKVVITARHTDILTDWGFAVKSIPPLRLPDALELFASRYTQHSQNSREQSIDTARTIPPTLALLLQSLVDRPLAIVLAANCVVTLNSSSAADHLQSLADDPVPPSPPVLGHEIWKWGCHVLEELDPGDIFLLGLLCAFDGDEISDNFLATMDSSAAPASVLSKRRYTRIIPKLRKYHLIQRRRNSVRQHYHIPRAIRECLIHFLGAKTDGISMTAIISAGTDALYEALEQSRLKSSQNYDELLHLAYPHIQSLSLTAKACNARIDRDFHMDRFALTKATQSMKRFSLKQFWRVWLINANFPLNEVHQGEDDGAELIVQPNFPHWIDELSAAGMSESNQYIRAIVAELVTTGFTEDLKLSTITAVVGQCWHGVREDIFEFLRTHPSLSPRNAAQIDTIIDFIDKGACKGLQVMIATYVRSDEYVLDAKRACEAALGDAINLVTAALSSAGLGLDFTSMNSETLGRAKLGMAKAWEDISFSSFFQICPAFETTFKGPFEQNICADLGSKLSMTIEPSGYETTTSFMVNYLAETYVKRRVTLVSRGYWEVMSALGLFFAADMLRELSSVAERMPFDSGMDGSPSAKLMGMAVELAREALTCSNPGTSPGWKSQLEKAAFWCVQAEECRVSREVYRNQDRWEEYRILSGFGGSLPVGDML